MAGRLRVQRWGRLANDRWPALLIGNGASINVWRDFSFPQLFQKAQFNAAAAKLFADLNTTNFESVLEGLWHADRVLNALRRRKQDVEFLYDHVRTELVRAVRRVHVPWGQIPDATLTEIADTMNDHSLVFTLNYDLLTYWALMQNISTTHVGDYFWGHRNTFDPTDTGLASGRTGLLYLHGGVHLWQDSATGQTGKWTNRGASLLGQLTANFLRLPNRQPLFVSEGTSAQKMSVIRRSDYLSFARQALIDNDQDTLIFGVGFGHNDDHVVSTLRSGRRRRMAVSIRPGTRDQQVAAMSRYQEKLSNQDLVFFDSTTHPLGDPALTVP